MSSHAPSAQSIRHTNQTGEYAPKGRKQRAKSRRGQTRADAPKDYWKKDARPLSLGDDTWRIRVLHGESKKPLVTLNNQVTSITWEDASSMLRGTVALTKKEKQPSQVREGDILILDWRRGGAAKWREVWRMRASAPEINIKEGTVSVETTDDLAFLQRSKGDFHFSVKKGSKGLPAHVVMRRFCKRWNIPVGKLAKMDHKVKKLTKTSASPLEVILDLCLKERNDSLRRLVPRMRKGRLYIMPLRRHRHMLEVGPALIDATVKATLEKDFATAFVTRSTIDGNKDNKKKKVRIKVTAKKAVKRYGYIEKPWKAPPKANTRKEIRRAARRELAKRAKVTQEVTLTHPGIPTIRRWDAMRVSLPDERVRKIVYVSAVTHNVSPGDYSMEITCRYTDPFVDTGKDKILKKKCQKARKNDRKEPDYCAELLPKRETPERGDRRSGPKPRRKRR